MTEREARAPDDRAADAARRHAERVARASYGRLLALLASTTGDIQLAEDCLGDAFERALRAWPGSGVPANPDAWLLTVARNRQRDVLRSAAHRASASLEEQRTAEVDTLVEEIDPDRIPDRRLALLFACAHPAIDPQVRTPLMLQVVMGLDAGSIARAFALPEPTLAQRLVRAKRRIREARIPFSVPERARMRERLAHVLEAIYGAFAIQWQLVSGPTLRESFGAEAHFLATTLAELMPDEPEVLGLAALLALSLARAEARGPPGEYVPLEEQDTAKWDGALLYEGEWYLRRAGALGRPGRFQLEAAIQSVHCARSVTGRTDWAALRKLYSALVSIAPTLGARVALAAAIGRAEGAEAGLRALDGIEHAGIQRFQPAWATRAHLLGLAGKAKEAAAAYERAISLTTQVDVRRFLEGRCRALGRREAGGSRG
jgi:RNA polymerase sigma factor (sigma-70 family)